MNTPPNKPRSWFWDLLRKSDAKDVKVSPYIGFRPPEISDDQVSQQWERLQQAIAAAPVPVAVGSPSFFRQVFNAPLKSVAAAVALLLLVSTSTWIFLRTPTHAYVTHYGETARIKLPDGSLVTLNAHSTLRYGTWQADQPREVWLEGEAFFDVQKKQRPGGGVKFVVHTNDLQVEVLGTRFNVSNRGFKTQVVLEEGKIHLRRTEKTAPVIQMVPGELVEYTPSNREPTKRTVDPRPFTAWKEDLLVLDGKSMREVARIITDNYGIEVTIGDSATAQLQLQGFIPAHNLDELVQALSLAADLRVTRQPNQITFTQR